MEIKVLQISSGIFVTPFCDFFLLYAKAKKWKFQEHVAKLRQEKPLQNSSLNDTLVTMAMLEILLVAMATMKMAIMNFWSLWQP